MKIERITIIGGGTWGTTLANMYSIKGYDIRLWLRNAETAKEIKDLKTNHRYTKDHKLSEKIKATDDNSDLFTGTEIIILAVPSHAIRDIVLSFKHEFNKIDCSRLKAIINVAKGLELGTNKRISEVLKETLPERFYPKTISLSGPNIAIEILNRLPSVSVIAGKDIRLLRSLQPVLSTEYFRVYTNTDLVGVELCGALKNIVAIAAGISDGLGYGSNAKASLITRGLYELQKFGLLFDADIKTFSGVAGMGDLVTTCISQNSRNRYVGEMLAKGKALEEILGSMDMVAEGINTTKAVHKISKDKKIELPITESVYSILYGREDPLSSVNNLMNRKFKSEV